MADQNQAPWAPENLPLDFNIPGEDATFLDGLMYNPLAQQNGEDFKPEQARVAFRGAYEQEFPGNVTFLHQQQVQPLRRPEPAQTAGTAFGGDSGGRSQEDEVTAARRDMKSNREKLLRARLNEQFADLAGVLDPGRPPKSDKASVLSDGINVVKKLREEIAKLQGEHNLLMDESKELTAEKMELREERTQVKAEKEALERRLQSMLSWMNFNPSLMMAAMANTPGGAQQQGAAPPQDGVPASTADESTAKPPAENHETPGQEKEALERAAKSAAEPQSMQSEDQGPIAELANKQAPIQAQKQNIGGTSVAQQGEGGRASQRIEPVQQIPSRGGLEQSANVQAPQRTGGQQPTRPLPVYQGLQFGAPLSHQGGLGRVPFAPPPQARVPSYPPAGSIAANLRQLEPAPHNAKAAPSVEQRKGKEGSRKAKETAKQAPPKQQTEAPQKRKTHVAADAKASGGGASGQAKSAQRANEKGTSEQPQEMQTPQNVPQAHPFPPGFAHMPYMPGFPGMMGMHPYSFPPQMTPVPGSTPPPENQQQNPPAFPYHGYPGNPPPYPYPMYPHAHPMAYPPFGFAHPYGAFAMPQQPQAAPPRPANVQRPSAKVAHVQLAGGEKEEAAPGGGKRTEAAPGEERNNEERSGSGETSQSQAAKRLRTEGEAAVSMEGSHELQNAASTSSEPPQQPTGVGDGSQRHAGSLEGAAESAANAPTQSSPGTVASQPSSCSSPSSGSRCGELWTQSFQSALQMPEHDPTIRPPAA